MSDDNKTARDFTKDRKKSVRAADWREDGLWVIVISMGGRNFCTYIGVPVDHPLAGHPYENIPIDCHGGLTFSGEGGDGIRPEGYYWYGWDYGHYGDYSYFASDVSIDGKDWTLKEVKEDARSAVYEMTKLKRLAEAIYTEKKAAGIE